MQTMAVFQRPLPLEHLTNLPLPSATEGDNHNARGLRHIDANDDLQAIHCWLEEFRDSPQTFRNYRKEAERLLLWSAVVLKKPLTALNREDFHRYQAFIADPAPSAYWCGPRVARYSENWRPFLGPLKASSQRQAMIVINALFSYLVDAGYLLGNPLSLIRRRGKRIKDEADSTVAIERFLDLESWNYLKGFIYALPQTSPPQQARFERLLFLFHFLYLLAPRVSEVASHTMNSFREYRGKWWWFVLGKGQKQAKVPVSNEMLGALLRYRQFLGLAGLPSSDDDSPLLRSVSGQRSVSASTVYRLVKATVQRAASQWQTEQPLKAAKLEQASTHWFRHTAITHQDDAGISLKYLNRNARHAKLDTTAIYQHAEDELWHQETEKHTF